MLSLVNTGTRTRYDILSGPPVPTPHGRAFGGQVMGQGVAAAAATVDDDRLIHSMHGYFLRPGDSQERMTFEVSRIHDGRSFTTRRVQAYQNGEVLMSLIASFQRPEDGLEHQEPLDMSALPDPESIPSVWEKYGHLAGEGGASWILNRPFDFRYLESDVVMSVDHPGPTQRVWMRSRDTMPDSHNLHAAGLTFGSDYLIIEPIMRQHGIPWATAGFRAASLDHAVWFHRPFRVDDWLLYELATPTSQGGRGLSRGRFYDRAGNHVATVMQEAMVRPPVAESPEDGGSFVRS